MPIKNDTLPVNDETTRHPGHLVLPGGDTAILIEQDRKG
jgi:hypothetical protein